MKKPADLETTAFLGAVIPEIRGSSMHKFVMQPGGNTGGVIHQPSVRNESVPNLGAQLSAA